jgi:hypothetical protein
MDMHALTGSDTTGKFAGYTKEFSFCQKNRHKAVLFNQQKLLFFSMSIEHIFKFEKNALTPFPQIACSTEYG